MKSAILRSSALAILAAFSITAASAAEDLAPLTVNGKAVPKGRQETLLSSALSQGQPDTPELRKAVREEVAQREILYQAAVKKGIDKKADVQTQVDMAKQQVVIGAYVQDYAKSNPVSDAAIQKEYDSIKARMGDKEYKARHILVEKEDEAKAIIAKLDKGEKFEDLAKQSLDPGSKDRGGDLGWSSPAAYVKPFSEGLTALKPGSYTKTPVKSEFGYHVIMLEDVRDMKAPSLEEVKPRIAQRLAQQQIEKHFQDLWSKAKVQ